MTEVPQRTVRVNLVDLRAGQHVTFRQTTGQFAGCGQGGQIMELRLRDRKVILSCGEAKLIREIDLNEWDDVRRHEFFPADKCELNFRFDTECKGGVDYRTHPPRGRNVIACDRHAEQAWSEYDFDAYRDSAAYYANSDVEPSWFDPADAGEHWGADY